MNRVRFPRRTIPPLLGPAIVSAILLGCASGNGDSPRPAGIAQNEHADAAAHAMHAAAADGEPSGVPTDFSIYHLDAAWTDQSGAQRQLGSLAGRVQVVAMIYTNCGYACPRILIDMKRIEGGLPPELRDQVGFIMVSIDPERDTPERLAAYADAVRLDPARWTLLTAPDHTVLELAALLGVKYRRIDDSDFSHTNVITVLDREGEIAHRQLGLGTEPGETLRAIERLARN